jgi:hypothetical protein
MLLLLVVPLLVLLSSLLLLLLHMCLLVLSAMLHTAVCMLLGRCTLCQRSDCLIDSKSSLHATY